MIFFFLVYGTYACNYPIDPDSSCNGRDTRTVLGEFSMIWMWISLTTVSVFGLIISIIRDIVPKQARTDNLDRYHTGESKSICRFMVEEYLLSGWFVTKTQNRFTVTSRWCLIIQIIFTNILITGILYDQDYDDPNNFKSRDLVYGFVSTFITFLFYLIGYFLLRIRFENEGFLWRKAFGFAYTGVMYSVCTIFVFVFTYKIHDDTDTDFTRLVDHWMGAFGYSMLFEVLISENARVVTRAGIIWSKRFDPEEPMQTNIELSAIERRKGTYENESFD
jgi:hypothetical protein